MSGPFTRHLAGECGLVFTYMRKNSSLVFTRQILAIEIKKRWSGVNPSSFVVSCPCSVNLKASYAMAIPAMSAVFSPTVNAPFTCTE